MIDVALIGTTSLVPLPHRALTAALLTCGGHSILFDCGEGTQSATRATGVGLMKTDVIALTHYHVDHTFGTPGLLQKGQSVQVEGTAVQPEQVLDPLRKGLKFVFSSDAMACDTLVEATASANLLVCEVTNGENEQAERAGARF